MATGYFSYDDATGAVANWNVHVGQGRDALVSFTYVPGNSQASLSRGSSIEREPPIPLVVIRFSSEPAGRAWDYGYVRELAVTAQTLVDGTVSAGRLDPRWSYETLASTFCCGGDAGSRGITAGSIARTPPPAPVTVVQVDEFYHPSLKHYFITASAAEKQDLDTGVHPGWLRTGESFNAYLAGGNTGGSVNPVCRYYGNPLRGLDSHFYSADTAECLAVYLRYVYPHVNQYPQYPPDWLYESDNVFQIDLPDMASGVCPVQTIPVYRLWNQRSDSNHRYTTSAAIKAEMIAAGYLAEGVVMCAVN
jgi:hypothetical protein